MTKCAKKYGKATVRQMTMEMVESQQDDNAVDSVPERDASHLQNQPGQSQISPGSEVASIADESAESEGIIDSQKRREILSRRPSYRKILNELSSDAPAVPKIEEEEKSEDEGAPSGISAMAMPTSLYHTNTGQYITITQGGTIQISNPTSDGVHGLQTLTMTNSGAPQPGATIVQYAGQSPDGTQQFFVPGSQVVVQAATGDMPAYQIRTPTSTLPQGVVMAASPGTLHSPQQLAEEATRKRELRLMKNSKMTSMDLFILKHPSKELVRKISEDLISSCPLMML
ncbi:cAMP-responsive element modulator isoform X8 [Grus americana]|uniref:cAMP-responsive element modulator isoform X8 n=1 Tax=Grus americana TaxID=9117 RepID=UPI00240780DC|nr:cAMP-responsive element modulator isoform X8 [Grus americana]